MSSKNLAKKTDRKPCRSISYFKQEFEGPFETTLLNFTFDSPGLPITIDLRTYFSYRHDLLSQ